jgi:hypothetical protein
MFIAAILNLTIGHKCRKFRVDLYSQGGAAALPDFCEVREVLHHRIELA